MELASVGPVVSEKKIFKIVKDDDDGRRRLDYTISSPLSLRLRRPYMTESKNNNQNLELGIC